MSDLSTLWRQRAEAAEARIAELEAKVKTFTLRQTEDAERVSFYKQSFNELQTVVTEQGEENARLREALAEARDHMDTTTDDLERRIKELLKPTRQVSLVSTSDYGDVLTNEKGSLTGQAQQTFQQTSGSSESYPKPAVLELKAGDGEVERSANTREDAGSNPAPRTHLEQSVQEVYTHSPLCRTRQEAMQTGCNCEVSQSAQGCNECERPNAEPHALNCSYWVKATEPETKK